MHSLGQSNQEFSDLVRKLIHGIELSMEHIGWVDRSINPEYQELTRERTTLRVAAGLGRATKAGFPCAERILTRAIQLTSDFILNSEELRLDSPDFACAIICLRSLIPELVEGLSLDALSAAANAKAKEFAGLWDMKIKEHASMLSPGRRFGLPSYEELGAHVDEKLHAINLWRSGDNPIHHRTPTG
jgi:hypothetical protein